MTTRITPNWIKCSTPNCKAEIAGGLQGEKCDECEMLPAQRAADKIITRMLTNLEADSFALFQETLTMQGPRLMSDGIDVDNAIRDLIERLRHFQGQLRTR
jgi:hypothetical protein